MLAAIISNTLKFEMEKELKKEIANYFLSDSREFLKRYELLKLHQTYLGNRSKLLIDILFSFECSIKSLIFLESQLDEKETYKKVFSHNLKDLLKLVDTQLIPEIVSTIDDNFEHFSVSSRYALEANIYFRNSVGVLDGLYYSTIANHSWLDNLYQKANNLYDYVSSKIDNSIKTISFDEIDIEKEIEKTNRLKKLKQK